MSPTDRRALVDRDDPVLPVQPCPHVAVHRAGLGVGSGDRIVLGPASVVDAVGVVMQA